MEDLAGWPELYLLERLKDVYLRTMYHEAAHTFHQRVEPTTDFDKITSLDYRQADWISGWTREGKKSIEYGFITNYASQEPHEDFAELFGNYVILSADEWEAKLVSADVIPAGAPDRSLHHRGEDPYHQGLYAQYLGARYG